MKNTVKFTIAALLAGGVLALGSLLPTKPVQAASTVMCAPQLADVAAARTIGQSIGGGSQSPIPSGTLYTLNGQGCTVVKQQDVNYLLGQGFSAGPPFGANVLFTTGVQTGTTSVQIGSIPASTYIQHIIVQNLTANAITGGLTFGTAAAGTQIASVALACGANCLVFEPDASLAGRIFSTTAPTPIFTQAVTAWNSANVTITVVFGYF